MGSDGVYIVPPTVIFDRGKSSTVIAMAYIPFTVWLDENVIEQVS